MRVIAVVFGVPTSTERNAEVAKMFDYAFNQYETHPLYERNTSLGQVPVSKGDKKKVDAVTSEPVSILTKKGEDPKKVKEEIVLKKNVKAPLKKGEQIGTLKLVKDG